MKFGAEDIGREFKPTDRPQRRTCSTCRWWQGSLKGLTTDFAPGECRALPPHPVSRWAITGATDFCGAHDEHQPSAAEMGLEARKG
jgi:hypothetical protein